MVKKVFLETFRRNIIFYILLFITISIIIITSLVPAKMLEHLIDDYFDAEAKDRAIMWRFILLYVGFTIGASLFDFFKRLLLLYLGSQFTKDLRYQMALKLSRVEGIYYSNNETGITSSRFINDVEAINTIFTDGIVSLVIDLAKILGIVFMMFMLNMWLGIATLVLIPLIMIITTLFKKIIFKAQMNQRKMIGIMNNHISETFFNERMIKIYAQEDYMINSNNKYNEKNYKAQKSVAFADSIFSPLIQLIKATIIVVLVLLANPHNDTLGLTMGMVAASLEYIKNLFMPIDDFGKEFQTIQKAMSGFKRVNEYFNEPDENEKLDLRLDDILKESNTVEFRNLSFAYGDKVILDDINIVCSGNKKYSFIGRTGVGKTTTFRLIEGILKPTMGRILINGINVRDIPNEIKFKIFGYVDQRFKGIKGTVFENISIKNNDISEEDALKALDIVGLKNKVLSFPHGINTIYNDTLFSNGEKQLLSIARAIAPNPRILLLDEITANLDSITMERVIKALGEASKGRMILEITHRLSSTSSSDKIIYLVDGHIDSILTPEEMKNDPRFKNQIDLKEINE